MVVFRKTRLRTAIVISAVLALISVGQADARRLVSHTFYLHGDDQFGEKQTADIFVLGNSEKLWMDMDAKKPTDGLPKSKQVPNAVSIPNTSCSGNPYFPVWKGSVSGTIKGDLSVTLHTIATPSSQIAVSLFRDLKTADCYSQDPGNSIVPYEYKPPMAVEVVAVPQGRGSVIAKFHRLDFDVVKELIVQVQVYDQANHPGAQVRLLYDSSDAPSSIRFSCAEADCAKG